MNLIALPAFSDNYIWLLHDGEAAVVVDPGDAAPVIEALDAQRLKLAAILVTHHHPDHVGGIDGLRTRLLGKVHGPARERIPAPFEPHAEGDVLDVLGLRLTVMDVPGHTSGHIAYLSADLDGSAVLFCGDTLFSAGCGRLFEGTAAQMYDSLARLAGLPGSTRVCCAHEYTITNLHFARAVEPGNQDIAAHLARCESLRATGQMTLPSTIERERRINPFLRCTEPAVIAAACEKGAGDTSPAGVFGSLREWKNRFR